MRKVRSSKTSGTEYRVTQRHFRYIAANTAKLVDCNYSVNSAK